MMTVFAKKVLCAGAVMTVLALFSASAQDFDIEQRYREHIGYLASDSLHGRPAGSAYEKAAARYVWDLFSRSGLEMLTGPDGDGFGIDLDSVKLDSRNIAGVLQGYDPELRNRYIVVGAHLDNMKDNTLTVDGKRKVQIFNGADDNASGLAMLAELARIAAENDFMFRRSIVFVAFGASEHMHSGAWYFLNRSFSDSSSVDMMINLDMVGRDASGFSAYAASNPDIAAMLRVVSDDIRPVYPKIINQDIYPGDHRVFLNKGIPSVLFTTGFNPDYHTERDVPERISYASMSSVTDYVYHFLLKAANAPESGKGKTVSEKQEGVYSVFECDTAPSFFNGSDISRFMDDWVYVYLRYPQDAVNEGIQGIVTVSFVVNEKGEVGDVSVVRGVHPLLDEEAVRVISVSPKWKPGTVAGEKVSVRITVPVEFRLARVR